MQKQKLKHRKRKNKKRINKGKIKVLILGAITFLIICYHIQISNQHKEMPSTSQEVYKDQAKISNGATTSNIAEPTITVSTVTEPSATKSSANTTSANTTSVSDPPNASELAVGSENSWPELEKGFVYLAHEIPDAMFDVRYATTDNFTGQVVDGYSSDHLCATVEAAKALKQVSSKLNSMGYGLLIYDAYRPKRAVEFFVKWGESPENNLTKLEYYPDIEKKDLFKLGYLAKRSAHSKGSTIDLTLFDLKTKIPLDMGSPFDFLGPISNHGTNLITNEQTKNRNILKDAMKDSGFKELKTEWWHYQLIKEPFPDTYFDFIIQ